MRNTTAPVKTVLVIGISVAVTAGLACDARLATASGRQSASHALSSREEARASYIVLFTEPPLATYSGGVAGIAAAPRANSASRAGKIDVQAPQSRSYVAYLSGKQRAFLSAAGTALGRPLAAKFTYTHALNGFAVELTGEEASRLAQMPGVASVRKSQLRRLSTDSGPAWIGAPTIWQGTSTGGAPGTEGEGVLVGDIDTGINFGSPSFAASGSDGYQHVNPNGAGTYLGTCAAGGADVGKCNDKVIGAYTYITSLPSGSPDELGTATDHAGHGSHTASTAAGNHAMAATADGASVAVSGVAPHANIIIYKVCFAPPPNFSGGTCGDDATSAAADQAVADGVDAINFSISGGTAPWGDDTSIAFRNAVAAGVFVAAAAGNTADSDPNPAQPGTANHLEPWTLTVGAATHDRLYSNSHVDVPGLGTLIGVKGGGGESGPELTGPVSGVLATSTDPAACTSFVPVPATPNFIAVIQRGTCSFSIKVNNAKAAGAAAVIVYDNISEAPIPMNVAGTTIPALMISQVDGTSLAAYVQAHAGATATADLTTPPTFNHDPSYGDIMGSFSLLGPAGGTSSPMDLLKPEISAPGLSILAAVAGAADAYDFYQGTSMATPHVTGSGALLRALHADWTPMEIKSALMLTAKHSVRKRTAVDPSDPFDTGAGRTNLTRAAASPLVMDETAANMEAANPAAGGDLSALNLPSLSKAACTETCTFTRTFRNPTATAQSFSASVDATNGGVLTGAVAPATFTVAPGATQSLTVTIDVTAAAVGAWSFGEVALTPASGDALSLPVAVMKADNTAAGPHIEVTPGALQSSQAPGETTTQTLTLANAGDTALTWTIGEQPAAVILSADRNNPDLGINPVGGQAPDGADVNLQIDVGLGSNVVGVGPGTPIVWLNRFTPAATDLPFTLDRVDLQFLGALDGGGNGAVIGEHFDVYIYQDNDDDPSNGAALLGSVKDVAVSVVDTALQSVAVPGGIAVTAAGDVLIAVVARDATGGSPATGDDGPTVHRSWIAAPDDAIADPPDLSTLGLVHVEDALATFTRNFVLRGHGTHGTGGACTALADVPWLSAAPASGTTAPSASSAVDVTFNSTGLNAGSYSANLCVSSNDTTQAIVAVPVTMSVTGDDTIFKDGFEGDAATTCKPAQLFLDPSFEATPGSAEQNPDWPSSDSNAGADAGASLFYSSDDLPITARTGSFAAYLGGWGSGSEAQAFSQSLVMPSGDSRYLNYYRFTENPPDVPSNLVVSVDGTALETTDLSSQSGSDYVLHSIDVSAYADGASHEVKFQYTYDDTGSTDGDTFIDDVTLDCTGTPPSATLPPRRSGVGTSHALKLKRRH